VSLLDRKYLTSRYSSTVNMTYLVHIYRNTTLTSQNLNDGTSWWWRPFYNVLFDCMLALIKSSWHHTRVCHTNSRWTKSFFAIAVQYAMRANCFVNSAASVCLHAPWWSLHKRYNVSKYFVHRTIKRCLLSFKAKFLSSFRDSPRTRELQTGTPVKSDILINTLQ